MQVKLTLRLDSNAIRLAKQYARKTGRSVSSIVADYFASLGSGESQPGKPTPKVRSLIGVLKGSSLDESDYRRYLAKK